MSTIVYQGLQSSLEPRLIEPFVFKQKLAPPKPNSSLHTEKENENKNGSFSFIQSLTTPQINIEKTYVHPEAKLSSNTLSKRSLEMCTESLGSETGSHEYSSLSLMKEMDQSVCPSRSKGFTNKVSHSCSFPPPLSSSHNVQVRRHLENGHLVIKAITTTSPSNYFQSERKDGHLRLSLMKEKLYTDGREQEENVSVDNIWVEGIGKKNENVGSENENRTNMWCKEEECKKRGISTWVPFLVATT